MTAKKPTKPRARFCWDCGKQLYGNHHMEIKGRDDNTRIFHKSCAKTFLKRKDDDNALPQVQ